LRYFFAHSRPLISGLRYKRIKVAGLVFAIDSYSVQEGQPILYKLYNGPKRSFVLEELQIVPTDTELPPQWILHN